MADSMTDGKGGCVAHQLRQRHNHAGAGERPFWTRARIDHSGLNTVTLLAYALAERWVSEEAARQFSHVANAAAAIMVEPGEATFNLWEEPGALVCHIVRDAIDPTGGPHQRADPRPGRADEPDPSPIVALPFDGEVHVHQDTATIRLTV